ncbi:MAG: putative RNA uridine N3 methyltransferase [Candidatus Freyarchaeum deiterrae]
MPRLKYLDIKLVLPGSLISDAPNLRLKTLKVGQVGRLAAIFRVSEILLYADHSYSEQREDLILIKKILDYMEAPQYLKKRLFPPSPLLKYAGVLPPLASPHHPLQSRKTDLRNGEFREGVVVVNDSEGTLVDIGVEQPQRLIGANLPMNSRVTVKVVVKNTELYLEEANPDEIRDYWGYSVTISRDSLGSTLQKLRPALIILTSKYGTAFRDVSEKILERWKDAWKLILVFGGPYQGLKELLEREKKSPQEIGDFLVNFIPNQATRTVRTEEAVSAALAVLNMYRENTSK